MDCPTRSQLIEQYSSALETIDAQRREIDMLKAALEAAHSQEEINRCEANRLRAKYTAMRDLIERVKHADDAYGVIPDSIIKDVLRILDLPQQKDGKDALP